MKEKLLHFIWRFGLLTLPPYKTTDGREFRIIQRGNWNKVDSGPDFALSQIQIDDRLWAGSLEMHLKSSDWDRHGHSSDPAYENVVLHVVYEHDREVDFLTERNIPTLELKEYILPGVMEKHRELDTPGYRFIPCEKSISLVGDETMSFWLERLLIDRLERKTAEVEEELEKSGRNWEKLLFKKMAYAFGLKINAEAFGLWADSFDYSVLIKVRHNPDYLQALFLGQAGFLDFYSEEEYVTRLQKDYSFLRYKFRLSPLNKSVFKFFRLRPVSFPTVRMMQLASVYSAYQNLFSFLMGTSSIHRIQAVFEDLEYPAFWENHFTLEKESRATGQKKISGEMIQRILINVIIPIKYVYSAQRGKNISEELVDWLAELPPEKNTVIAGFSKLGKKPKNALESQALLELKKHFCKEKKCLNCAIGLQIMKDV